MEVCCVCECEFDLDSEGGVCGHIGILFFCLCPTCHSGMYDFYINNYGPDDEDDDEGMNDFAIHNIE